MTAARRTGSDLVVDLLVEAGVRYVAFNPGASTRGLQDSLAAHPDAPRPVLCLDEGIAVGVAQGWAKATGTPMAVLLHDVVGLQNAAMAVYNAWCDRTPVLLLGGTGPMSAARRRPWIDWIHTASAQAEAVRDYVKWDAQPHDLASVPESFARAWTTACAEPAGPVYLCLDVDLQEQDDPGDPRPPLSAWSTPTAPAAPPDELDALADRLRAAERPLLVAGHVGETPEGFHALAALADVLAAPVLDAGPRLNVATCSPWWAEALPGVGEEADLLVLLDVEDPVGAVGRALAGVPPTTPVVQVSPAHLRLRSWAHDFQSLQPSARHVTSAPLPAVTGLLDRLRAAPPAEELLAARRHRWGGTADAERQRWRAEARADGGGDGAVPLDRLLVELSDVLDDVAGADGWVLASGTVERREHRLWPLRRPRQWGGHSGGGGLGYAPAAAVGVALGSPPGTVVVDVQSDGDLLYAPQALWTAARLRLPVLYVVHDNRRYGNTYGHALEVARERGRDEAAAHAAAAGASALDDPAVDLAGLAHSFGVAAWGPVGRARDLPEVLAAAARCVRDGQPALVDVLVP